MTTTARTASTADGILSALETARRHVVTERTNDVEKVMATVSARVCYLMPDVTSAGGELTVTTDRAGVRDYYTKERTFLEVVSSTVLAEVTSDWYAFREALSTTRQVATGTLHRNEVIVLFPVADDGIIGEILAARRTWVDVYTGRDGRAPAAAPDGEGTAWRARAVQAHERMLDAWRSGRAGDAAGAFAADAAIAVVDPGAAPIQVFAGTGPDAAVRRCRMVVDAIEDREVTVLNRVIGEWYVFAETLVRGQARHGGLHGIEGGAPVELRTASIFPVGDSRLLGGEQAYSVVSRLA